MHDAETRWRASCPSDGESIHVIRAAAAALKCPHCGVMCASLSAKVHHVVYCSRNPDRLSEQKAAAVVMAAETFKEKELLYAGDPQLALREASLSLGSLGDKAVAAAVQGASDDILVILASALVQAKREHERMPNPAIAAALSRAEGELAAAKERRAGEAGSSPAVGRGVITEGEPLHEPARRELEADLSEAPRRVAVVAGQAVEVLEESSVSQLGDPVPGMDGSPLVGGEGKAVGTPTPLLAKSGGTSGRRSGRTAVSAPPVPGGDLAAHGSRALRGSFSASEEGEGRTPETVQTRKEGFHDETRNGSRKDDAKVPKGASDKPTTAEDPSNIVAKGDTPEDVAVSASKAALAAGRSPESPESDALIAGEAAGKAVASDGGDGQEAAVAAGGGSECAQEATTEQVEQASSWLPGLESLPAMPSMNDLSAGVAAVHQSVSAKLPGVSHVAAALGWESVPGQDAMFASMDKNGNGVLTKKEIKNHLKHAEWAQPYITAESFHWSVLWDNFDADGDGTVSRDEFDLMYQEDLFPLLSNRKTDTSTPNPTPNEPAEEAPLPVIDICLTKPAWTEVEPGSKARSRFERELYRNVADMLGASRASTSETFTPLDITPYLEDPSRIIVRFSLLQGSSDEREKLTLKITNGLSNPKSVLRKGKIFKSIDPDYAPVFCASVTPTLLVPPKGRRGSILSQRGWLESTPAVGRETDGDTAAVVEPAEATGEHEVEREEAYGFPLEMDSDDAVAASRVFRVAQHVFDAYDVNGRGSLPASQLAELFTHLLSACGADPAQQATVDRIVRRMTHTGIGRKEESVTLEEWITMMTTTESNTVVENLFQNGLKTEVQRINATAQRSKGKFNTPTRKGVGREGEAEGFFLVGWFLQEFDSLDWQGRGKISQATAQKLMNRLFSDPTGPAGEINPLACSTVDASTQRVEAALKMAGVLYKPEVTLRQLARAIQVQVRNAGLSSLQATPDPISDYYHIWTYAL